MIEPHQTGFVLRRPLVALVLGIAAMALIGGWVGGRTEGMEQQAAMWSGVRFGAGFGLVFSYLIVGLELLPDVWWRRVNRGLRRVMWLFLFGLLVEVGVAYVGNLLGWPIVTLTGAWMMVMFSAAGLGVLSLLGLAGWGWWRRVWVARRGSRA